MKREQFDVFVRAIEKRYKNQPGALRWRVALWAGIGYFGFFAWFAAVLLLSGVFLVPAAFIGLQAWFLWLLGGGILLAGGWTAVRTLWLEIPAPKGREISRQEAPALYAMIDELRGRLRSKHFHNVILTYEYNAAVRQSPRLGVFGWWRNYLLLGLPLMDSLSEDELRAVVAHELAHLSRQHGRFSHWLYRLRAAWDQVFERLRAPSVQGEVNLRSLLAKYVEWFWPYFNAHAFVFSRTNEYEADALSAEIAGKANAVNALARIAVASDLVDDKFWCDVWQRASRQPEPPAEVLDELRKFVGTAIPETERIHVAKKAFQVITTNGDTHPCLRDRLAALGVTAENEAELVPFSPPTVTAAEKLLGANSGKMRADVAEQWRTECLATWRDRHGKATALQDRLQHLAAAVPDPNADVDALWDKARIVLELESDAAAEPLLRQTLALRPDHVEANFCLGRHLLAISDPAGESHLECAMAADEQVTPQACDLLFMHFRKLGLSERLKELRERLDRYEETVVASRSERSTVSASDNLLPHGLSEEELAQLREVFAKEPDVASAQLARKELRYFPNQRLFLLCVRVHAGWHGFRNADREQATVSRLSKVIKLPGRVLVFAPAGTFRPIARKISKMPGTTIVPNPEPLPGPAKVTARASTGTRPPFLPQEAGAALMGSSTQSSEDDSRSPRLL